MVYAGLRTFLSAKASILIQLVMPLLLTLTYLLLLTKPAKTLPASEEDDPSLHDSSAQSQSNQRRIKLKFINWREAKYFIGHLRYMPRLLKYMVPLFFVYISEYMINQGLFELLYYDNTRLGALCLDQKDQYRWLASHDVTLFYCDLIGYLLGTKWCISWECSYLVPLYLWSTSHGSGYWQSCRSGGVTCRSGGVTCQAVGGNLSNRTL